MNRTALFAFISSAAIFLTGCGPMNDSVSTKGMPPSKQMLDDQKYLKPGGAGMSGAAGPDSGGGSGMSQPAAGGSPTPNPTGPDNGRGDQPPAMPGDVPPEPIHPAGPPPGEEHVGATPSDSGSQVLAYRLPQGSVAKFETIADMSMTMPKGFGQGPLQIKSTTQTENKIVASNADGFKVQTTVLDSKVSSSGSKNPMTDQMAKAAGSTKGAKMSLEYKPSGSIKTKSSTNDAEKSVDALASAIGFQGLVLPGKPVKPGDSWESVAPFDKLAAGMGGMMKMEPVPVHVKYIRRDGNSGVFQVYCSTSPKMTGKGVGMSLKLDYSSLVTIDLPSGLLRESHGDVTTTIGMGEAAGGSITQKMKVSTRRL